MNGSRSIIDQLREGDIDQKISDWMDSNLDEWVTDQ
jgi:hypothetical protein